MNAPVTTRTGTFGRSLRRGLQRYRLVFLSTLGLLVLYAVLGFWWLPNAARQWAVDYARTALHRPLELGSVEFNPFTLTARVRNGALREADGSPLFRIDELLMNFEVGSLWHRAYTFKQVRLTAPNLQAVVSKDGVLNLASLRTEPAEPASASSELPSVRIDSLELVRGELHFEDRSRPAPFSARLMPVEFTLRDFRTQPRYRNAYRFSATSTAGEHLDWSGEFTLQPLGSTGQFRVAKLQAATIADYLQDSLPFSWRSGIVDLDGTYRLTLDGTAELALRLPSITIAATEIGPKNADASWLTAMQIELRDTVVSPTRRDVAIQALRIQGLDADVQRRADGSINLLELLGPETPDQDAPWAARIDEVALDAATVRIQDLGTTPAASWVLAPVTLKAQGYSTAPNAAVKLQAELRIDDGGVLKSDGTVRLAPLDARLAIDLADLDLAPFQPYVAQATDMVLRGGRLTTRGELSYRTADDTAPPDINFTGDVAVADLSTRDNIQGQDFLRWRLLRLTDLEYQSTPAQLSIDEIYARQPYSRFIINADRSTNVQRVLRLQTGAAGESAENPNAESRPTQTRLRTRVKKVRVDNGSAFFADYSVEPSFSTGIVKLNGDVSGLSSANQTRAKVKLAGSVDNHAPVSIDGEVNFLAADAYSDLAMNFRNMELTTFNPYSGKFAGYSIAKGKLSTELRYRIENRKLDAQHHIVIDQLEFGPATGSKDAVPLPIKFAVSLLKDRNDVIDLNLPVGGSLDDPSFRIGPIIWKAFVNLLTKAVTAPFSALGALFGGGDELAYVEFAPGSPTLGAEQAGKLAKLAAALVERPQLRIDVPLTTLTPADVDALNKAAYEQALAAALPRADASPAERLAALTKLYERQTGAQPVFPAEASDAAARTTWLEAQLHTQITTGEAERAALARARADAVQAALLANNELAADRVFLTTETADSQSPPDTVRMQLKLDAR